MKCCRDGCVLKAVTFHKDGKRDTIVAECHRHGLLTSHMTVVRSNKLRRASRAKALLFEVHKS